MDAKSQRREAALDSLCPPSLESPPMIKLTSVIHTLEAKRDELQKDIRTVDIALAALNGGRARTMDEETRARIGRAVSRAWKKRKAAGKSSRN